MTLEGKLAIQRALGTIEGVAFGLDHAAAFALAQAVELIDEVISKEDTNDA